MSSKNINEEEVIIVDYLGNEIVVGLEITIPSDIAEENGAHEDDAHTPNKYPIILRKVRSDAKEKNTL